MSDVKLWKQEKRDFLRALQKDGTYITIKYYIKRSDITNSNWVKTEGVVWQINDVLCLKEVVSELTFADVNVGNIQFNKNNFRFQYEGYDFHDKNKKYFQIIDENNDVYEIDKIVPTRKIGVTYLAWTAIQK